MTRRLARWVFIAALAVAAPQPGTGRALAALQLEEPHSPRLEAPLTILQLNDVYTTVPINDVGGLARVATLKKKIAAEGRAPFLVLAGDFLSPSVASSTFKGEQMIAALNAAGLDLATLGNHEFDFGDDLLIERMRQARWTWVAANVIDTRTGSPIGGARPYVVRQFGPMKVGFLGLCLNTSEISRDKLTHTRIDDPLETAAQYVPKMRAEGLDAIVAVTHVRVEVYRELAERFPDIALIVGGHEHFVITAAENATLISKAGSDARWVARIDVSRRPTGTIERVFDLIPIDRTIADDPETAAVVASYENRLSRELDTVVGSAAVPLDAMSLPLRSAEAPIGDLVADALRAGAKTELALLNSGSIRGDRIYPAGPITRRTVVAIHPFGNTVCVLSVPGRVVREALENGVSRLPQPAGRFPQVSGLTVSVDITRPPGSRVTAVVVGERSDDSRPLDDARMYTIAIPDFLLKGGDDYTMFAGQRVIVSAEAGELMVRMLEDYIAARKEVGVPAGQLRRIVITR